MKSNFTTAILFFILIILLLGIILLGGIMYLEVMGQDFDEITHKIKSISTEEVEVETQNEEIIPIENISIENNISSNVQKEQTTTGEEIKDNINKYYYNQLEGNQKIIYQKLNESKPNLKQGDYVIDYGEAFSDTLSKEDGSIKLGNDYQTAIEAFTHDNPELFYLDVNKMCLNIETTTKFLRTKYKVYITGADGGNYLSDDFQSTSEIETAIMQVENIKNTIIRELSGNDYKKITYVHDYLVKTIEYDSTCGQKGTYNLYGALVGRKCVCEGYAKALKYILNEAGIECELMQGTATNSTGITESHAWNCVKLDGIWYEIDVTWDDPIIIGNNGGATGDMRYRYFLKGRNTFEKDHVLEYQFSEDGHIFSYPTISEKDY